MGTSKSLQKNFPVVPLKGPMVEWVEAPIYGDHDRMAIRSNLMTNCVTVPFRKEFYDDFSAWQILTSSIFRSSYQAIQEKC